MCKVVIRIPSKSLRYGVDELLDCGYIHSTFAGHCDEREHNGRHSVAYGNDFCFDVYDLKKQKRTIYCVRGKFYNFDQIIALKLPRIESLPKMQIRNVDNWLLPVVTSK